MIRPMTTRKRILSRLHNASFCPKIMVLFLVIIIFIRLPSQSASKPPVIAKNGMVATSESFASRIGVNILKKGGNAVDAAVAIGFALAVTHPAAGNLGGGGFMMIRLQNGETTCIDYRERAPSAASKNVYLSSSGSVVPEASTRGYRASGVPGTVAGLCFALKKFGRLSLWEVIQPAIDLAEKGFPVSDHLSQSLKDSAKLLQAFPESARIYLREGKYFEPGETFVSKDLAWSLKVIRDQGLAGFYHGPIAQKIAQEYKAHGSWITQEDLSSYEPVIRVPLQGSYREYGVITVPPPSSGGIVLLEMLNILERYNLSELGAGSSQTIHFMVEAMRRSFRDRCELMGDPDFVEIPVRKLISKQYAESLRSSIQPEKASATTALPSRTQSGAEKDQTTHYSIVDNTGNAVANTYTLNGSYGSGVTVAGTGILMNNEMDDFTAKVGMPNADGLIQGESNGIDAGKRPLSSMTPTFLTKDGKLFLVIGSPGGPTIINTVLQVILNLIDFNFTIQEAIDAPRVHHQWLPDQLKVEIHGFARDVTVALRSLGHHVVADGYMGDAEGILLDPKDHFLKGASDPRGDGLTVGY